jgi:primosomal protein N''
MTPDEKSPQQRDIEQASVDLDEAGYDTIDLSQHLDGDLMASDIQTPASNPEKQRSVKQKKLATLRKIYNGFEIKDMTFEQFCKEFMNLTDQTKIHQDLASIAVQRARGRSARIKIDKAMGLN